MERSRRTPCSRKRAGLEVRSCALAVEEAAGPKGADSRRSGSMSTVWTVRSGCSSCLRWRCGVMRRERCLEPEARPHCRLSVLLDPRGLVLVLVLVLQ